MKYLKILASILMILGFGVFLNGARLYMDIKSPAFSNEKFFPHAVAGIVFFLAGIAFLVIAFTWRKVEEPENDFWPTKPEIYAHHLIGTVLFFIGFTGVMWAPFLIPFCLIYGIYLLRVRKRHFFVDLIFSAIFFLPYWLTVPLLGPAATYLKMFFLGTDWSDSFTWLFTLSVLTKAILLGSVLGLLVADILVFIPSFRRSDKKGLVANAISLLTIIGLFVVPLLRQIGPAIGNPTGFGSSGCSLSYETIKYNPENITASRDEKNNWVYQIKARSYSKENAEIIKIVGQKPKNALFSRKEIIGPPFGENISITVGHIAKEKIIIPPDKDFVLKISSREPIYSILVISKNNCKNSFGFLTFDYGEKLANITMFEGERMNPDVRIILAANFLPGDDTLGKTEFQSGEQFYANEVGLPKGSHYGFQVISESDNFRGLLINRYLEAKMGNGIEGSELFNDKTNPMKAGDYIIQLVQIIDGKAYIVSKKDFVIKD